MEDVFHKGEREVQRKAGEEFIANSNGRVIANTIIKGAINFISTQPIIVISSADENGAVWTSLLAGDPGFVTVKDEQTILISKASLRSVFDDIFFSNIENKAEVGILFIEPATRRRYRVNGKARLLGDNIEVAVQEAYPNCPKYIQKRFVTFSGDLHKNESDREQGTGLNAEGVDWIKTADTLFVGSIGPDGKMDASHRGGPTGFVEIIDGHILKIPDYAGNSMYNTLGNFAENPAGGITFIDFNKGQSLQLSGKVQLIFDQKSDEDMIRTTGTGRYWLFQIEKWIITKNHHEAEWKFEEFSPFNP